MNQLNQLRTFLAVYRVGSVTKAAVQLALTQPAVSGHIKALETHLKRKLFRRVGRGIAPTAAAESLARAVAPHLDGIEAALAAAAMRHDSLVGTVRLGGPIEFMTEKVLPALSGFPDMGIRLELRFGVARDLIEGVQSSELDMAIATVRIPRKMIGYDPVFRETFVLVGAPRWAALMPPAMVSRAGAAAVTGLPWLGYGPDLPIVRRYFRQVFRAEPPPEAVQVIPDLRALTDACVAGAGITVLPKYLCASYLAAGSLVVMHDPSDPPSNDILLAWNRLGLRQPLNAFVRDRLLQAARSW
ncbi:LysR family transcriptional regulator [Mesorhizobium sp.]|uniref:LysR family transcriptional regulator n=1 Tax=Mesorhizobium sp. TaxID=1871066 RepID=UPI000FE97855|nr:LysR family transcriptional regulator [Mesorhizobium sp.]RWM33060.1 MAG: LysR family transcriptional regulator [Mesorhizobium sp.]TJV48251.1 MAG: LysR family transcriptional regulator [Mesorhizobium sp.]